MNQNAALILVDIQNDFLPGGALAVPQGDEIIPLVNELQNRFDLIVATQDWHPKNHGSFAENHDGKEIGELISLNGLQQILWPVHCVQETDGGMFAENLNREKVKKIFPKGTNIEVDSYSGFYDNGHFQSTGLSEYLKEKNITRVFIVGLATDYCVKYTALDALKLGFETIVFSDATRAVNIQPGDFDQAIEAMENAGVKVLSAKELLLKN